MNQNRFRLVFNKHRGMLMAVAECANGAHKAASGERAGGAAGGARGAIWAALRPLAWALLVAMGGVQMAGAQIVSDPRAGHGPGVTTAPNGTPLVNIQAPSGAGVSHNQYQQFSVDGRGAILNNATSIAQTQLGGYVPGNANLGASGPARVILNEITGTSPSQLNGYIEMAGRRADVVVSNLNGISINGGGFLNVNRATLTTGTPVFGGDGSLAAFRVTRGGIQVEGQGFNGTNLDQVDLIARSVTVNANLWANQVNVMAGANQVDYASLGVQVIQGEGAVPTVGIDVSNLGGMYANRIRLIGSEAGVGVRSAGTLAAQAGDFSIDSAGRVTLTGSTSATGNLAIHGAQGVDNLGTTAAGANLSTTSEADIQNTGALIAGQNLGVTGQSVQSSGTLAAGIDANGNMSQAANLSVSGVQGVVATGQNLAGSNMAVTGGHVSLAGSQTRAVGAIALTAQAGALDLTNATVTAGQGLTANAAGLLRSDGAKVSAARIDGTAQQLSNRRGGTLYARNGAALTILGNADNTDGQVLTDAGDLTLSADGLLSNARGRVTNAGAGLAAIRAQRLENTNGGVIGGNGAASVTADQLFNTGGAQLIAGTDLGLHLTQSADNAGGQIYAGQRLTVDGSQVSWRNDGGAISGKSVQISGASLSNRQGTILADEDLKVGIGGDLDNTGGVLQGGTTLDVSAAGTLSNDAGQLANTGTGKTSVTAATVINTNGATLGGNGDVAVSADRLANTASAQLISGKAMEITAGLAFNNAGGQTYGSTGLTVNGAGAALSNDGGGLAAGGNTALKLASLSNEGGKVVADGDINLDTAAFTGTGTVHAGNDLAVAMQGDYVNTAANLLKAEHNLIFGTTGTFSNQGKFEAVNALTINGRRIVNEAGATINSATTTLNASADIANAGRIEGDALTTNSDTLDNTGTLIGDSVTANAREIHNTGAAAIMAATDTLNVYGRELVTNTEGATYYSLGDLNIAANSERDERGYLRNRTGRVLNDRSTIEGGSDYSVVEIAAQELINQRPDPVIVSDTTVDSKHQLKREKYIHCATTNAYPQMGCTQALWEGPYKTPVNATFTAAQILSRDDARQRLVVNINGIATQIDYNTLTESNGVLQVNYWDGYDRDIHYDPGTEYAILNDAQRGWQRVEIARDTTTTTVTDRDANPNQPSANLVSGGAMILANVGSLTNRYSTIASGGSMQIGDQSTSSGALESGQFGATTVTNVGQTLYQRTTQDIVSTYAWSKDTTQDVGPVVQPSVVMTPVVIGRVAGSITAGQRLAIYGGGVQNQDVGKSDPMAGTGSTTVTGTQVSAHRVSTVTLTNQPLNLPSNGLYKYHTEPGYTYLIETDPRFTKYGNFLSSDYMLGLLGIDPAMTQKRLGDGFYEQKLIRDQVSQLTGRVYLAGYDSAEEQYKALMASGVQAAQQFNILPGMALTAAQMEALTTDIVWLVSETVTLPDGSTQSVLVPRIYLARAHAADLQANGALIAADDLELHSAGTMQNSGIVDAKSRLSIAARDDVVNRGGAIRSAGVTAISAGRDIVNQSGQISGDKVGLVAARDIQNTTLFDQQGEQSAAGNAKASTSLYGQQAGITSTGGMLLSAGRDITATGSTISAGGDAAVLAGRHLTFDTLEGKTHQSVYNSDRHHSEDSRTEHTVSSVQAGGSLTTSSGGDTTLKGTQVKTGSDLTMVAGGDLKASAVINETSHDNVARQSKQRQQEDHRRDQSTVGVNLEAGGNATLAAVKPTSQGGGLDRTDGQGKVSLIGANVTAGANGQGGSTLNVVADRDVTVAEVRELHDSSVDIQRKSGSFVSRTSTSEQSSRHSDIGVGSTLSGDTVRVKGGNDVTVRQSAIAATDGVALTATRGNVLVTAGQNIREDSDAKQVKKSGISGFAGQGGIGVSVGKSEASGASHTLAITQSDARSVVGASNGNVIITAGKDAAIIGSDLIAGRQGNKEAASAGNIDILAQNVTITEGVDRVYQDASQRNRSSGLSVALVGTPYDTAKNLQAVQQDPSTVSRVTGTMKELGASALTLPQVAVRIGNQKSNAQGSSVATTSSGSNLTGAGNVRVRATGNGETDANGKAVDGNILVSGSTISAGDAALLDAARDVTLRASTDTYQASNSASSSGWQVSSALPSPGDVARHLGGGPNNSGVGMVPFGSQTSNVGGATTSSKQNASTIKGNTVGVKARTGDITIAGSGIAAEGDVALSAVKGKIDILSGQDTLSQRSDSASRQIGDLGGTGYSGTVGVRSESHYTDVNQTTQNTIRSQVVSKSGNVTMSAGENITARGADIAAGNDVTMIGKNVILDPGTDAASQNESHRVSQYGTTLALSGYTVTAAQAVENAAHAVEDKKDGRVATLYGVQAGLAIANGIQGIQTVTSGGVSQTAAIKVTASVGGGSQSSESHSQASTNQGSAVKAGNAVTIVATGSGQKDADGFATDGDISGRGAQIEGKTVTLSAARDVNLESAQDHATLDSRSSGSNASIGVGFGLGGDQNGFTLELAASQNKARANGESVTNHNSHVLGTDRVTVLSGRDTNLKGAQLIGDTVAGTVGRDLNIESRPDTETYHSKESSSGMQASICVPPFCYGTTVHASGSVTQGNTDSTYSSVQEQSGIYAGKGGFNLDVKGNTDLKGGILASTADAANNHFKTGTLTTSDIENKAEYSSDSTTLVASYSGGKSVPASDPNLGPVQPAHVEWAGNTNLLQGAANSLAATAAGNAQKSIDGSAAGVTRSAIAVGTVTLTDSAGQQAKTGQTADETVAGLNRDTANANQSIDEIFDAQKVKDQRELNQLQSQVAQQLAPMVYQQVGDVLVGAAPETKAAVHALVGGLLSEALGGSFDAGAAGGAAASLAMEAFGQALLDQKHLSEGDRKALVQLAGAIVGGAAGAAAGGSLSDAAAGVSVGKVATESNYLSHVEREKYEKSKQACSQGNANACAEAKTWEALDQEKDRNLAGSVNRCHTGEDCQGVSNFILDQMKAAGCGTNPSSADCTKLGNAWLAAQKKAQGLEAPLISPDDLIPYKGISTLAVTGVKGATTALVNAGLLGIVKNGEAEAAETVAKWAAKNVAPTFVGSGPAPGVIAITDSTSVGALRNYHPAGGGIEFVFDTSTNTFAVGKPRGGGFDGSPHQQLAQAIGAKDENVVGGTFSRAADGSIVTTENSGHYGQNWTPEIWAKFQKWLSDRVGVPVNHQPWGGK